jgi:prolipoprotein diacylglyceryltransferase
MMGLGAALMVLGVLMIIKPSLLRLITESWKTNDGEGPTRLYLMSTQFGGIMLLLAGAGGVIVSLL